MDIEGAELDVLKDCEAHLHKIDNLFVEFHSFKNHSQQLSDLLQIFENNGFRYDIYSLKRLKKSPMLNIGHEKGNMDLQLNIFARRL
jgi:predicted MarR family transcription regulator